MNLIERVVAALREEGVSFAIVGGYALALHGAPRGTVDLDLMIKHSQSTFIACERALKKVGLTPRLPVQAKEVYQFRKEYIENRNMIAWSFINPKNPIEIVDIILPYDLADYRTIQKKFGSIHLTVLSLDDLIAMKRKSNRPQDREDVKTLEGLKT